MFAHRLMVALCALGGFFVFSCASALAASAPLVEGEWASGASVSSVTLAALVNPEGESTEYRFEYGPSTGYGTVAPSPDVSIGSGSSGQEVTFSLHGLPAHTTYHFRLVAHNALGTTDGQDYTVATEALGGSLYLPDGRVWEQVSPVDKHGALIRGLGEEAATQAAASGGAFTFPATFPTEEGASSDVGGIQVVSTRGAGGWSSRDVSAPQAAPVGPNTVVEGKEYPLFSEDLSTGLLEQLSDDATALSSEATPGEQGLYVRRQALCASERLASQCFYPLVTSKEGYADVPPGTAFGGVLAFQEASRDMSHVALTSVAPLAPAAAGAAGPQMYEWSPAKPRSEQLQMVSVLPASEGGGAATSFDTTVSGEHAVSDDGSRVFWMDGFGARQGPNSLYVRDTAKGETVRLDVVQPGAPVGRSDALFEAANTEGSRAYFIDYHSLTAQSSVEGADLYECRIVEEAGKLKCVLTDLTPETGGKSSFVARLLPGVSEDGSYVYFVTSAVLAPGATPGTCKTFAPLTAKCNLYVRHDGTTTFIATMTEQDHSDWGQYDTEVINLRSLTARTSSDGRYLSFMSSSPLTGYDNLDANSGKPDQEVYLYDAVAKRLTCASCMPTGTRPIGIEKKGSEGLVPLDFSELLPSESRVSAVVPTWNAPKNAKTINQEGLYQPRYLSDNGRLLFDSLDALVPQDINGTWDVYQYEPVGTGDCSSSSASFSESSDGCVGLVSSGTSPVESQFLDASATGGRTAAGGEGAGDVFFETAEKLVSGDTDTSYDVYDAHECSVGSPCVSAAVVPPACTTADGCRAAPGVQPAAFGAPASATFSGTGNTTVSAPVAALKAKGLTRAQKLARALSACRKKRPSGKRVSCERLARRRYGPVKSSKANAKRGVR